MVLCVYELEDPGSDFSLGMNMEQLRKSYYKSYYESKISLVHGSRPDWQVVYSILYVLSFFFATTMFREINCADWLILSKIFVELNKIVFRNEIFCSFQPWIRRPPRRRTRALASFTLWCATGKAGRVRGSRSALSSH